MQVLIFFSPTVATIQNIMQSGINISLCQTEFRALRKEYNEIVFAISIKLFCNTKNLACSLEHKTIAYEMRKVLIFSDKCNKKE